MPTSVAEHCESHSISRNSNIEDAATATLILASNAIAEHDATLPDTTTAAAPATVPDVVMTDAGNMADSEAVLTRIFRTDTENTARNSLLEDFLQLVEPDNPVQQQQQQHAPLHGSSSMDTVAIRADDPPAHTPTLAGIEADPRLSRIEPDQLKPLATLFTEFYEAQATSDTDMLPQYRQAVEAMHHLPADSRQALMEVLNDIDRLAVITGDAFADQRVALSSMKEEEMAAISLAKRIVRLSTRMDSQRVDPHATRRSALIALTDAIERSGQQMADQRVDIDQTLDRRMQLARVTALVEKMDRTRLSNQDWLNPQLQREDEIARLTQRLQRTPSAYVRQRFTMSGQKQRDMFIDGIMTRIRRLDELRMSNQDAEAPRLWQQQRHHHQKRYSMSDYEAIEQIVSSTPERFENQRASTSRKSSSSAASRPATTATTATTGHRAVQSLDIRRRFSSAAEFFRAK